MPNKKEDDRRYGRWFVDPAQEGQPALTHAEFCERLKTVYNIDPATTKGMRSMRSHIDGDTWFSWEYEWEIAGRKFVECTCDKRRGQSLHNWSH
jgi:hypothetical protein